MMYLISGGNQIWNLLISKIVQTRFVSACQEVIEDKTKAGASGPNQVYNELIKKGLITKDERQRKVITLLQKLHDEVGSYSMAAKPNSFFSQVRMRNCH